MNFRLIAELVRLRYKLLWARTRTRNGRIALFMTGYLLFVLVMILLAAGGLGAGILAVQSGKAQMVAEIVLGSLFVQAVLATILMGFGMNAIFSDFELRRYPIGARERRLPTVQKRWRPTSRKQKLRNLGTRRPRPLT